MDGPPPPWTEDKLLRILVFGLDAAHRSLDVDVWRDSPQVPPRVAEAAIGFPRVPVSVILLARFFRVSPRSTLLEMPQDLVSGGLTHARREMRGVWRVEGNQGPGGALDINSIVPKHD